MKALFISLSMILTASAASAATDLTATLRSPVKSSTNFVREQTAWICEKDQCRATVTGVDSETWLACRQLVRKLGPVSAYGVLDATALAKCNGEQASK